MTINCSERGLLLLRVRDEVRLTIAAYQTLYESSIAFGMRKALMAEQRKADMEQRIRQLQNQCEENEQQVRFPKGWLMSRSTGVVWCRVVYCGVA